MVAFVLLWQGANVLAEAMPARGDTDFAAVSACECGSGMCDPEHVYHAHLREFLIQPVAWADVEKISPALPELRPEPKVTLVQVAAPALGHIDPEHAVRIPEVSPFLRSPKLLL